MALSVEALSGLEASNSPVSFCGRLCKLPAQQDPVFVIVGKS